MSLCCHVLNVMTCHRSSSRLKVLQHLRVFRYCVICYIFPAVMLSAPVNLYRVSKMYNRDYYPRSTDGDGTAILFLANDATFNPRSQSPLRRATTRLQPLVQSHSTDDEEGWARVNVLGIVLGPAKTNVSSVVQSKGGKIVALWND